MNFLLALEAEANQPVKKTFRLSQPEVRYCIHMMEKYGDNYEVIKHFPKYMEDIMRKF